MNITTKKIITVATGLALAASVALPAFAQKDNDAKGNPGQENNQQGRSSVAPGRMMGGGKENNRGVGTVNGQNDMMGRGVFGVVASVSGTTITLNALQRVGSTTATTTFTVDASKATVRKNNATSTVSAILVGDKIVVQGTVTGTSVVAKAIFDGIGPMMGGQDDKGNQRNRPGMASSTASFMGNGQPVIAGSISAINGNTLTVTTMASTTYTVDASNAKILQGPNAVSLSTLTVGEKVIIQGTINGTSVIATTVIDQVGRSNVQGSGQQDRGQGGDNGQGQKKGIFGNIGGFFKHLFGF